MFYSNKYVTYEMTVLSERHWPSCCICMYCCLGSYKYAPELSSDITGGPAAARDVTVYFAPLDTSCLGRFAAARSRDALTHAGKCATRETPPGTTCHKMHFSNMLPLLRAHCSLLIASAMCGIVTLHWTSTN